MATYLRLHVHLQGQDELMGGNNRPERKESKTSSCTLSASLTSSVVKAALVGVFGYVHGAIPFEVLAVLPEEYHAVIKVDKRDTQNVLSALPLLSRYKGKSCYVEIVQVGHTCAQLIHDPYEVVKEALTSH